MVSNFCVMNTENPRASGHAKLRLSGWETKVRLVKRTVISCFRTLVEFFGVFLWNSLT